MARTINEIVRGVAVLGPELAEKAREVKENLMKLAQGAPDQQLDVASLTETRQLSLATRKILSLTARIKGETEDVEGSDDEGVFRRRSIAAGLCGRIKTLCSAYSIVTGEELATYFEDDALSADMNEVTFRTLITPELHRCHRGPPTYGELTTDLPSFPLLGTILSLPNGHSRDVFSVIVTYKEESKGFPFFVHTGGTRCYANKPTLECIKPGIDLTSWTASSSLRVHVHGVDINLYLGQPGTSVFEVNLLGTEWMEAAEVALVCDYSRGGGGCALVKGDDPRNIRQFAPSTEVS